MRITAAIVLLAVLAAIAGTSDASSRPRPQPRRPQQLWYTMRFEHDYRSDIETHFLSVQNGHGFHDWHLTGWGRSGLVTPYPQPVVVSRWRPYPGGAWGIQVSGGKIKVDLSKLAWGDIARVNGYNPDAPTDEAAQWDCLRSITNRVQPETIMLSPAFSVRPDSAVTYGLPDPQELPVTRTYTVPEITCPVGNRMLGQFIAPTERGGSYRYPGDTEDIHDDVEVNPRWLLGYDPGPHPGGAFSKQQSFEGRFGDARITVSQRFTISPQEENWESPDDPGTLYKSVDAAWWTSVELQLCGDGRSRDEC